MNFSGKFGSASTIWYPASGFRSNSDGSLNDVGYWGCYWSASPYNKYACILSFSDSGRVNPYYCNDRGVCKSVRCIKE